MKLPSFLRKADEEPGNTVILPEGIVARTPKQKVQFHIDRFTRARAQCEKGEKRATELQANLDYWTAIQAAEKALEKVN